jgi:heme-degrading monooxygenase HmoA
MATMTWMKSRVESFEAFEKAFATGESVRKGAGMQAVTVARDAQDPSILVIEGRWSSAEAAKKFLASSELREMMKRAGVQPLEVHYFEIASDASYG